LPTNVELEAERASWSQNNSAGAFASPLKLPLAGYRNYDNGSLIVGGGSGYYWSSTVNGTLAFSLGFVSNNANVLNLNRAKGYSVRCLKN
jgi:hypothetical protein